MSKIILYLVCCASFSVSLVLGQTVSTVKNDQHYNVPSAGVLSSGILPDLSAYYPNGDKLSLRTLCEGKYTVLAAGCLTCPEFHRAYSGIEALSVDFSPLGVQFFYVYKSLRHPELGGYVEAQQLSERLMMVDQIKEKLGTQVPWLVDGMDDAIRIALRSGSQSVYLISPEGEIIHGWGKLNTEDLRHQLESKLGESSTSTTVADLNLPVVPRSPKRKNDSTDITIVRPEGMSILSITPMSPEDIYYVKLRAEADSELLKTGTGRLALGFFPDPIHDAHWNNLTPPMKYELDLPKGVTATPQMATAKQGVGDSDTDPRQFWVDIIGAKPSDKLTLTLHYYGCTPNMCEALTHKYIIELIPEDNGARTYGFNRGNRRGSKRKR